ncbi:hypothetical protein GCM10023321_80630 [Pseudonocardia eucalypti]|uniref:SnoaL-like domain-containing protein n=1 Tax=Pseudonocardia eucalypti TaxID=648755 RepID=A0ABP9RDV7_9PSEU|nr:hypothetical protein [Pseudonocardia eucalypti]
MNRADAAEQMWVLAQVNDCLDRYSSGIDARDVGRLRECYHQDAVELDGIYGVDLRGFIELVHRFRKPGCVHETVQHAVVRCVPNQLLDAAQVESYLYNVIPPKGPVGPMPETLVGARFVDRFECRSGRWAIANRQLVFVYARTQAPAADAWHQLEADRTSIEANGSVNPVTD